MFRNRWGSCLLIFLLVLAFSPAMLFSGSTRASAVPSSESGSSKPVYHPGPLYEQFRQAAKEFHVPLTILLAVSYAETHWQDHHGKPSELNGYGLMHLADNPTNHSLPEASQLLGIPENQLKNDVKQNIRGGAAVLAQRAKELNQGKLPQDLAKWYTAVAAYSGLSSKLTAKWYADEVYSLINHGAYRLVDGKDMFIRPTRVIPDKGIYADVKAVQAAATPDYPYANWVAASSSNYTAANRVADGNSINYIIIHTTEGSYSGTINWFQNLQAQVSSHYVIRSSDGEITQMVQNKDIAWHAGNWDYNVHSIGIEHEGYVSDPSWFTDAMYRASASLTRWLCDKYGIPKDRSHIIGHNQVPGSTHTDPGSGWDWNYYMSLVNQSSSSTEIVVDNSNTSRVSVSGNWALSSWNSQKYGADYYYTTPQAVSEPVWFKFNVPSSGSYSVYAWWPADPGYNSNTPYIIRTSSGNQTVYANQQAGGGKWNYLGTFNLPAGDQYIVGVSRWTSGTGYVIADAVKLVKN
ncbi:N-acetylmuramoyl-L-alanine amidase [Thermoactinomyces sp. CICC 10521]|uniref:golvesin C-terminal-like domain-containing protein n=1 Tax=Thermoactinomyces sp. CICC 10521 TaxID=2767426 RepID=UPI0018DD01D7|nr:N-acetylmuramoyl-L-alanine amidase [Thermoactinomyces sp. CICC 10521]